MGLIHQRKDQLTLDGKMQGIFPCVVLNLLLKTRIPQPLGKDTLYARMFLPWCGCKFKFNLLYYCVAGFTFLCITDSQNGDDGEY